MPADPAPFTHRLVGAVHVITVFRNDPQLTRRILGQERSVCSARRIIIDLSRIHAPHDGHLDVIQALDLDCELIVRLGADRHPVFLGGPPTGNRSVIAPAV